MIYIFNQVTDIQTIIKNETCILLTHFDNLLIECVHFWICSFLYNANVHKNTDPNKLKLITIHQQTVKDCID